MISFEWKYNNNEIFILVYFVNDVIADKNVVTKIMNNSTGLQRIELNGFAKRHLANWLLPLCNGWCLGLC